ncbi:MAG: GIDE domain-containing protein, partial [Acidobacteriota bacterium]
MWFFGLLLLAAAGGFAYGSRSRQRQLGLIGSTEVCTVAHLRELAASMSEGLGEGSLRFPAAVNGTVRCAEPLTSELGEVEAVHYSMSVRREVEGQRRDNAGNKRDERRSEQLAHERKSVAFTLEDATGSITVDPTDANFTTE